jgi:hypothetical protein
MTDLNPGPQTAPGQHCGLRFRVQGEETTTYRGLKTMALKMVQRGPQTYLARCINEMGLESHLPHKTVNLLPTITIQ